MSTEVEYRLETLRNNDNRFFMPGAYNRQTSAATGVSNTDARGAGSTNGIVMRVDLHISVVNCPASGFSRC